jgi:hypothetical protein
MISINKTVFLKVFIYAFLIIGYLNTILRLNPEGNLTLFRLLMPVAFLILFVFFTPFAMRYVTLLLIFFIYGFIASYYVSRFGNFNLAYFFHYGTLIFIGVLIFAIIKRFGIESVYNHLRGVYILMIVLAGFQFLTDFEFPNTTYLGTINIYYWVDNDFGAALASFIPFLLVNPKKKITNKLLAAIGLIIIAYNGSRIALLSIIVFLLFNAVSRIRWFGFVLAGILGLALFIIFKDYKLGGDTLYELLVDPFRHISTLTSYDKAGSINDRTNALIFGITELISTNGIGVGPGNATAMFELPEYFLPTAQSMHNFIAQVVVEYGWLTFVIGLYGTLNIYNYRRSIGIKSKNDNLLLAFLLTAALASLSQSEGLFSNYYFFVSFFTSFSYFGNQFTNEKIYVEGEASTSP